MAKIQSTRIRKEFFRKEYKLYFQWISILFCVLSAEYVNADDGFYKSASNYSVSYRFRRSADKFGLTVSNLQSLARISSGIALEVGLIDGKISSDAAIAELLHIGDLKLTDLIGLDTKGIDEALADLPNQNQADQKVKDVENRLIILEKMREKSADFKDFLNFPGKLVYEQALTQVRDLGTLKTNLTQSHSAMGAFRVTYGQLKGIGGVDDQNVDRVLILIGMVHLSLKDLEALASGFSSTLAKLTTAQGIIEKSNFLGPIFEERGFRAQLGFQTFAYNEFEAMKALHQKTFNTFQIVANSSPLFQTIQKLAASRTNSHRQTFQFTSGLPRGRSDLEMLNKDSSNQWVMGRTANGSIVMKSLEKAFILFNGLAQKLKYVEDAWKLDSEENQKVVQEVVSRNLRIAEASGQWSHFIANVDGLKKCDNQVIDHPNIDLTNINTLKGSIEALNNKLLGVSTFEYMDQLKDLSTLKKPLNIDKKLADNQKMKSANEALGKIKNGEDFKNFENSLNRLITDLNALLGFIDKIDSLVSAIQLNTLDKYEQDIRGTHTPMYDCLRNVPNEYTIRQFAEIIENAQVSSEAKKSIKAIANSGTDLKAAQGEAEKFKRVEDYEAIALADSFKNNLENSLKLGLGVQGLAAIEKAHNANLKSLLDNVDGILKDSATSNGLSDKQKADLQKLTDIWKVIQDIENFLKNTKSLDTSRRRKRSSNFEELKSIFDEAGKIQGVQIDTKSIREAMEILDKAFPQKYTAALASLSTLETLDLDFGRFKINDASASLASIDASFASYALTMSKPPPAKMSVTPSLSTPSDAAPEENPTIVFLKTYWYIPLGTILLIVLAICFAIWLYRRLKKPKPKPEPIPDPPVPDDSTTDSGSKVENKTAEPPKPMQQPAKGVAPLEAPAPPKPDAPKPDAPAVAPPAPPPPPAGSPPPESFVNSNPKTECLDMIRTAVEGIKNTALKGDSPRGWARELLKAQKIIEDATIEPYNEITDKRKTERRNPNLVCNPATMPKVTNDSDDKKAGLDYINANEIPIGGKRVFMGQTPLKGSEHASVYWVKDTLQQHWGLIDINDVGIVVQLCTDKEILEGICPEWFSTEENGSVTFGNYVVKTKEKPTELKMTKSLVPLDDDGPYVEREAGKEDVYMHHLEFTHTKNKRSRCVDVLVYTGWSDKKPPTEPEIAGEILDICDGYKNNMLFICSDGVGRSGSLAAIKYGTELCLERPMTTITEVIQNVRKFRYGAVQKPMEVIYILLCIAQRVMKRLGMPWSYVYDEMHFIYYTLHGLERKRLLPDEKKKKQDEKKQGEGVAPKPSAPPPPNECDVMTEVESVKVIKKAPKKEDETALAPETMDDNGKPKKVVKKPEQPPRIYTTQEKIKAGKDFIHNMEIHCDALRIEHEDEDAERRTQIRNDREVEMEKKLAATGEKKKPGADEKPKKKPTSSAAPEKKKKDGSKKSQVKPTAEKKEVVSRQSTSKSSTDESKVGKNTKPTTSKNKSKSAKTKIKTKK